MLPCWPARNDSVVFGLTFRSIHTLKAGRPVQPCGGQFESGQPGITFLAEAPDRTDCARADVRCFIYGREAEAVVVKAQEVSASQADPEGIGSNRDAFGKVSPQDSGPSRQVQPHADQYAWLLGISACSKLLFLEDPCCSDAVCVTICWQPADLQGHPYPSPARHPADPVPRHLCQPHRRSVLHRHAL